MKKEIICKCLNVSGDNGLCPTHHLKKLKKLIPKTENKKECTEQWHVFQPAGNTVCNCGASIDNPLNILGEEAKKYNL